MTTRVGINGFGRIGRQSLKAIIERAPDVEVVAVNDLVPTEMNALLFKHDSTYGAYPGTVEHTEDALIIDGHAIRVLQERDPASAAVGRPRRGRRRRVHRPVHRRDEGQGPPRRWRAQGHHQRARQERGHHGRPGRQRGRLRPDQPPRHQQRQLHDELPRAGGQGRPRQLDDHARSHEHDPLVHERPAHPRRRARGPASRACGRPEHHPDDDRGREGARARHPGPQGQVRRLQPAGPDADGQRGRLHRPARAPGHRRRAQRRLPRRRLRPPRRASSASRTSRSSPRTSGAMRAARSSTPHRR